MFLCRDCAFTNIMMDPGSLFLSPGFHPMWYCLNPDASDRAKYRRRNALQGGERVKYVFIDFGISAWYNKEGVSYNGFFHEGKPAQPDCHGADRDVPELGHPNVPHDPFKVDVFMLGNVFRKKLVNVRAYTSILCGLEQTLMYWQMYANLKFLEKLAIEMTDEVANTRPTAAEAKKKFEHAMRTLSGPESRRLLRECDESSKMEDLKDLVHEATYQLRKKLHAGK
jgi:hypothetical protein